MKTERSEIKNFIHELGCVFALAAPLGASFLLQRPIQTITLVFIGHFKPNDLGICALGNMM